MITLEQVEKVWDEFKKRTDRAEQHQFLGIAIFQVKAERMYKDLHENWDEDHAAIFIKVVNTFMEANL